MPAFIVVITKNINEVTSKIEEIPAEKRYRLTSDVWLVDYDGTTKALAEKSGFAEIPTSGPVSFSRFRTIREERRRMYGNGSVCTFNAKIFEMATVRSRSPSPTETVSPDLDIETVDPRQPHGSSFTIQMIMELKGSHGSLTQAVQNLSEMIERQGSKLDKIEDLRVDFARYSTKLDSACDDLRETKTKLDRVHSMVIGAAAVVAFLVVIAQIALRAWPMHEPAPIVITAPAPAAPAIPKP
jgi:hypothetical protein